MKKYYFLFFFLMACYVFGESAFSDRFSWRDPKKIQSVKKAKKDAKAFTLMFSKNEWAHIGDQLKLEYDLVLMRDGTLLHGQIEEVPDIEYFFGDVSFQTAEVSAIVFAPYFNNPKMQIITWNGENYIGKMPKKKIIFFERKKKNLSFFGYHYVRKAIAPESIDTLVLKKRKSVPVFVHESFMSMRLFNGDRFPFRSATYKVGLTDGKKEFYVRSDEIVDVRNRGGLEGFLKGVEMDRKLDFSLIRDKTFSIRLAKDDQELVIPWTEIERIWGDDGAFVLSSPYFFSLKRIENMVYIPPGDFFFGSNVDTAADLKNVPKLLTKKHLSSYTVAQLLFNKRAAPTIHSPPLMITMPGIYVDKYEVSNKQYLEFVESVGYKRPKHWIEGKIPKGLEDHPVTNISFHDAQEYAKWAGKHIPTEIEWERCAKGASGFPYPYGPEFDPGMSNVDGEMTKSVGSYEGLVKSEKYSPESFQKAVQDMSGNVAEWTSTPYDPDWLKRLAQKKEKLINPKNRVRHPLKVVKGGSFKSSSKTSTTSHRTPMHEDDYNDYTGFRCISYDFDLPIKE